ncbi:hypothetical protein V8G54_024928 [Vigna mungo]|uniref:Uncharacterized protein n=1 Tax=Vigna mungo TaxID=3915 RepID=A0AAQ3N751_VIGMU
MRRKNDRKLSSLAKDLGFQLLSDDMDIGLASTQQPYSEVQSNQIPTETSEQGHADTVVLDGDSYRSAGEVEENPKLTELSSRDDELIPFSSNIMFILVRKVSTFLHYMIFFLSFLIEPYIHISGQNMYFKVKRGPSILHLLIWIFMR